MPHRTTPRQRVVSHLRLLQRRLAFLDRRIAMGDHSAASLPYLQAETAALRWALPVLESHIADTLAERHQRDQLHRERLRRNPKGDPAMFDRTLSGRRVRLDHTDDQHTDLRPGALGTVRHTDDAGTLHIDWDEGSTLGLIEDAGDRWTLDP